METVEVSQVLPTEIWIESDVFGGRTVMLQHDGMPAFAYATFNYNYAYTSNAGTYAAAERLAISLGATVPVEQRSKDCDGN